MGKLIVALAFWLFSEAALHAQNKYLVYFKDKVGSPYTVSNPTQYLSNRAIQRRQKQGIGITEREFPPNPSYLQSLRDLGVKVLYKTRWLNGALIETDAATLTQVLGLSFVKGMEGGGDIRNARIAVEQLSDNKADKFGTNSTDGYGFSLNQVQMLCADSMHMAGFRGEGMLIGVLDSGFLKANQHSSLQAVFSESRVVGTYDFVQNHTNVYDDDKHGTNVLSCMAANTADTLIGTAYKASYLLLRTEDALSESKIEEAYWVFGAEYADSVGVDVINSSLGYSEFDNPAQNYTPAQMNGDIALCTRAADFAAAAGILVVVSAGNQGNDPWQYITAPSDADSVLAIAAVTPAETKASFSSVGYPSDTRIKPDLAAQGTQVVVADPNSGKFSFSAGTSFAAPLLAGMAAGFWQANPSLTNMQVIDYLKRSATQANAPDKLLGYGIPNFKIAQALAGQCANVRCVPASVTVVKP
jgi:serine protease AprX